MTARATIADFLANVEESKKEEKIDILTSLSPSQFTDFLDLVFERCVRVFVKEEFGSL